MSSSLNRLCFANLAANGAEQLALAAIPLVAAMTLGATAETMGALSAAQSLPYLLLSLFAGLWADRLSRRRLMAGAEAARALLLALLPLVALAGWMDIWALAVIGFALSTATVVFNVAAQAYLPGIVAREGLAGANAKIEFTRAAAIVLGPGLAGAIAAWTSPVAALAASAVTSALTVWVLLGPGMQRDLPPDPSARRLPMRAALAEGIGVVWRHPLLRAIAACAMAWNFSWFVLMAVMVLYAMERLGLGPAEIGAALAAQGVGMLLAAVAAPLIHARLRLGHMILLGPALSVLAILFIAATTQLQGRAAFAMLGFGFFTFGFGPMLWTIGQTSLRQAIVPLRLIGRVSAVQQVATLGMRPLGALVGGVVGGQFGLESAIWLSVAGYGVQLLAILLSPMPRLRDLPPELDTAAVRSAA
jgi:predicted MFS family arabinose efflux permease